MFFLITILKSINFFFLGYRIWDYLIDLSNLSQTTIIITTHYIDEARYANMVGFMRNGRIIEENHPNQLFIKYNENVNLNYLFFSEIYYFF